MRRELDKQLPPKKKKKTINRKKKWQKKRGVGIWGSVHMHAHMRARERNRLTGMNLSVYGSHISGSIPFNIPWNL